MFFVYLLLSLKDKRTYVGYTSDLEDRMKRHDTGQVRATRYRRPLKLLFIEKFDTIKEAKEREYWWKSSSGRKQLKKYFTDYRAKNNKKL